ncbi:hypothetical protein Taro_038259 [Colocasia esculenta]|uniref:Uncharacterized protein n=1 Tax=Colocasia esculenta TaxID=4460 RepID=A0A843WCA5_COLES|nr:hypothetical protein [Colocasia esculenta]
MRKDDYISKDIGNDLFDVVLQIDIPVRLGMGTSEKISSTATCLGPRRKQVDLDKSQISSHHMTMRRLRISPVDMRRDREDCAENDLFKFIFDILNSMENDTSTLRNESDERWWSRRDQQKRDQKKRLEVPQKLEEEWKMKE